MADNPRSSSGGTATSSGTGMYPGGEDQRTRDAYDAQQNARK